ncbi:hypothetical protein ACOMHN_051159 [Nucella lapillus]
MELGILHNSPPSTKRGCRAGRLHRLWHGLPPAPWPCTRSQHHSVPSRNLHPLMVPPFLQPHPDLQSAVGNAPLSSKHPAQLPTTDCLLSIISPMGGQPSDAPALSPPSPLQQGGQSSNAPALSPPSPLPQGGQPIALALSPPSPPPQGGQPSDAPGLSPSSSTLLLCPSDSTLNICHLNSQSAVKTGKPETISDYILEQKLDIMILTETWLSESGHETSCNLMTPSGFVLKSYPRASKGGGIAVIFRESLVPHVTFKKALPFRHSTFEVVELTISCSGKSTCIVCIYRPPPNAKNKFSFPLFLEEFEELVDYHNTHSPSIILIGDFNIHFDNPHNSDTKQICELLTSYELVQLVDKPTRKTHILDWIISREASDLDMAMDTMTNVLFDAQRGRRPHMVVDTMTNVLFDAQRGRRPHMVVDTMTNVLFDAQRGQRPHMVMDTMTNVLFGAQRGRRPHMMVVTLSRRSPTAAVT